MPDVRPDWSLDELIRDWQPHPGWRDWFSEGFALVTKGASLKEQLDGWRIAATIFGDMHACQLCLFVCFYGRSLLPPDSRDFLGAIDLCLWDMGLATPVEPGPVAVRDIGKPETMHRDQAAVSNWLTRELSRFGGDLRQAAEFSMRLTAIRLGLLTGPNKPTVEQLLDGSLWR